MPIEGILKPPSTQVLTTSARISIRQSSVSITKLSTLKLSKVHPIAGEIRDASLETIRGVLRA